MRRFLWLSLALLFFEGCKGGVDKTLQETIERDYALESGGTLQVKNEDGSIRVYGSGVPGVHVKAIKRAYTPESLRALGMRVTAQDDSVAIETTSPLKSAWSLRDRSGTVDYTITVPQSMKMIEAELVNGEVSVDGVREGNVRMHVINGRLSARDSFSNVAAEADNGAIDFYYDWWEPGNYTVTATIPNGSIGLFLPHIASFHVDAETQQGGIMGNMIDEDEIMPRHRKRLSTRIGMEAGPRFQFKTIKGNIRIHGY